MRYLKASYAAVQAAALFNPRMVFVSPDEILFRTHQVDAAVRSDLTLTIVPAELVGLINEFNEKLHDEKLHFKALTLNKLNAGMAKSSDISFVDVDKLTESEADVYKKTDAILAFLGGAPENALTVLVAKSLADFNAVSM